MDMNELLTRSATDPEFRAALIADPRAALSAEGVVVPAEVGITVVESVPGEMVLALPPAVSDDEELSEDALAGAAAGTGFVGVLTQYFMPQLPMGPGPVLSTGTINSALRSQG
ncbi:NHLP leader peptide family RiPP precursor [Nakamurella leprariae]|uniref:NHLP leader peptide family RiPP n=1 Tax=Nakamurella leprariae TaxID=2803911 RepID=A0A939C315_9ACTN|nr:NHLP leader peptide family RiPP precursor [Nakamurella leprariae]MBM9468909.1 NHLP leader peptide family RiPP precursor [Nakamurella leprariae]